MKNMSLSRAMTFAVISALAMLSLAAPSSAQQGTTPAAPSAPVAQQAPAVSQASGRAARSRLHRSQLRTRPPRRLSARASC